MIYALILSAIILVVEQILVDVKPITGPEQVFQPAEIIRPIRPESEPAAETPSFVETVSESAVYLDITFVGHQFAEDVGGQGDQARVDALPGEGGVVPGVAGGDVVEAGGSERGFVGACRASSL